MKPVGRIRVRPRPAAPRALRRPPLRDLIETSLPEDAAPDEILDTVTGPFGRVVEVEDVPRKR